MHFGALNGLSRNKPQEESSGQFGQMRVDSPGNRLGELAKTLGIDPAHAAMTPATDAIAKVPGQNKPPVDPIPAKPTREDLNGEHTLGSVFANEIVRRLEEGREGQGGNLDTESESKDSSDLRHSLGQAMDWVRERFGDETAAAAAGMVLQSTSSGVSEDTLSDGLLNTLKFIDRNFGVAAGDAAIAKFNGTLNDSLNEYFDNGHNELFHAVETPAGASPVQSLGSRILAQQSQEVEGSEETKTLAEQLLNKLKEELDEKGALQETASKIEAEMDGSINVQANIAINAYANQSVPVEPQFTSQTV